ncbi:hypothetical protein MD273_10805 [Marinobacter pelagius]|uniref:hypothetical protein n=1 Tax=Marinobacter sp. C7 TaxID=2951363 RepID=UPI001EEFA158|nr:hypothetical protein [Marinobacter sp. C7]MCG7200212.1 hypothetical protein [Marinobacter sp. C7]
MKIYQPAKHVFPKLISMFPFGLGLLGFLLPGMKSNNYFLSAIGVVLVILGAVTFFARSERFIDTEAGMVIKRKRWLFFQSREEIPLRFFKYICVIENSEYKSGLAGGGGGDSTRHFYDVNLVGKNSSSDHAEGFEINMFLGQYPRTKAGRSEAMEFGSMVASQVGLPLRADKNF